MQEDLNDADFYLNHDLRRFWFPMEEADAGSLGTGIVLPTGTLLVGRTKHLGHAGRILAGNRAQVIYQDKNWMVLRIITSLDLTALREESVTTSS